jgi:hypothetical protein
VVLSEHCLDGRDGDELGQGDPSVPDAPIGLGRGEMILEVPFRPIGKGYPIHLPLRVKDVRESRSTHGSPLDELIVMRTSEGTIPSTIRCSGEEGVDSSHEVLRRGRLQVIEQVVIVPGLLSSRCCSRWGSSRSSPVTLTIVVHVVEGVVRVRVLVVVLFMHGVTVVGLADMAD